MKNVYQKSLRQWNSIRSYQLKVQIALNYEEWSTIKRIKIFKQKPNNISRFKKMYTSKRWIMNQKVSVIIRFVSKNDLESFHERFFSAHKKNLKSLLQCWMNVMIIFSTLHSKKTPKKDEKEKSKFSFNFTLHTKKIFLPYKCRIKMEK
jgi:hypothetical protein